MYRIYITTKASVVLHVQLFGSTPETMDRRRSAIIEALHEGASDDFSSQLNRYPPDYLAVDLSAPEKSGTRIAVIQDDHITNVDCADMKFSHQNQFLREVERLFQPEISAAHEAARKALS